MIKLLSGIALAMVLSFVQGDQATQPRILQVLFVGNSYTYTNNLPELVSQVAALNRAGTQIRTAMVAIGGATLQQHWQDGRALSAIRQGHWDYVVLQDHSLAAINMRNQMDEYMGKFAQAVRAQGAQPVFYMTWARRFLPDSQPQISAAYQQLAQQHNASLAPVGNAFQVTRQQLPQIELYTPDQSHPAPSGSILAAGIIYRTLTGESIASLPGDSNPVQQLLAHANTIAIRPTETPTLASTPSATPLLATAAP